MPRGDPYSGVCAAGAENPQIRECCNTGYARGVCPNFPAGDAPDAVRFGIVKLEGSVASIRYVRERDHHPHDSGVVEPGGATLIERQADAYLRSYLRRVG